jgi:phosphoribosyl 1,2-cyclic phosphodiesterase
MKLTAMGTRGSIPAPSRRYPEEFMTLEFGGNTTCYVVETADKRKHVIDGGSGLREYGMALNGEGDVINLYFTHTHWDHIQGVPFFRAAYNPKYFIDVYGEAKVEGELVKAIMDSDAKRIADSLKVLQVEGNGIRDVLNVQQNFRNFPAPLSLLKGIRKFYDFIPGGRIYEDDCTVVETARINHPGGCVSYKFREKSGKVVVIATDFEPDCGVEDEQLVSWLAGADVVVADAQYEAGSVVNPFIKGWGHSDFKSNVELTCRAGVKRLILTHHEPRMNDAYHASLEERAKGYALAHGINAELAREGATYEI